MRLLLDAEPNRLFRATAQFARVNNDGSIGVFHVLQGAPGESTMFQFPDRIPIGNPADFITASSRTPTAAIDSMLQRRIKRRAINAGLAARNYFHVQHCSGGRVTRILQCAADTAASTEKSILRRRSNQSLSPLRQRDRSLMTYLLSTSRYPGSKPIHRLDYPRSRNR